MQGDAEILVGHPDSTGPSVMRIRARPGTVVPPHTHPVDEGPFRIHWRDRVGYAAGALIQYEIAGAGGGRRLVEHAQALRGGALSLDVDEQNAAARAFDEALGFVVVGRSLLDGTGRPDPLLHLRRSAPADGTA